MLQGAGRVGASTRPVDAAEVPPAAPAAPAKSLETAWIIANGRLAPAPPAPRRAIDGEPRSGAHGRAGERAAASADHAPDSLPAIARAAGAQRAASRDGGGALPASAAADGGPEPAAGASLAEQIMAILEPVLRRLGPHRAHRVMQAVRSALARARDGGSGKGG